MLFLFLIGWTGILRSPALTLSPYVAHNSALSANNSIFYGSQFSLTLSSNDSATVPTVNSIKYTDATFDPSAIVKNACNILNIVFLEKSS